LSAGAGGLRPPRHGDGGLGRLRPPFGGAAPCRLPPALRSSRRVAPPPAAAGPPQGDSPSPRTPLTGAWRGCRGTHVPLRRPDARRSGVLRGLGVAEAFGLPRDHLALLTDGRASARRAGPVPAQQAPAPVPAPAGTSLAESSAPLARADEGTPRRGPRAADRPRGGAGRQHMEGAAAAW
jgi:hypothetical protein